MSRIEFKLTLSTRKYDPFSKRKKIISRDYNDTDVGFSRQRFESDSNYAQGCKGKYASNE